MRTEAKMGCDEGRKSVVIKGSNFANILTHVVSIFLPDSLVAGASPGRSIRAVEAYFKSSLQGCQKNTDTKIESVCFPVRF